MSAMTQFGHKAYPSNRISQPNVNTSNIIQSNSDAVLGAPGRTESASVMDSAKYDSSRNLNHSKPLSSAQGGVAQSQAEFNPKKLFREAKHKRA